MNIVKISDAEYEIMEIIWAAEGEVTTADIIEKLGGKQMETYYYTYLSQ